MGALYFISIFFIVMGLPITFAGIGSKKWAVLVAGLSSLAGGSFSMYGTLASQDSTKGQNGVGAIVSGVCLLLVAAALLLYQLIIYSEDKKKEKARLHQVALQNFYDDCLSASCTDFSMPKTVEKAKLLANKYGLTYENGEDGLKALFEEGKKSREGFDQHLENIRLEEIRKAEKKEFSRLDRYAYLYGREKRIAMLTDEIAEEEEKAQEMGYNAQLLMYSSQQKESDWATWGGIANGLAGPAAGLATAAEIQAKNAQVRAENEVRKQNIMPAYTYARWTVSDLKRSINAKKQQIEQVNEKLLADTSADNVMDMLEVTNTKIETSETGACTITATVSVRSPLFIFDDVPAIADGTIVAHIFEDGREVGAANMVLPTYGVATKQDLKGLLLYGAHKGKQQTVAYSAGNLWLMER